MEGTTFVITGKGKIYISGLLKASQGSMNQLVKDLIFELVLAENAALE